MRDDKSPAQCIFYLLFFLLFFNVNLRSTHLYTPKHLSIPFHPQFRIPRNNPGRLVGRRRLKRGVNKNWLNYYRERLTHTNNKQLRRLLSLCVPSVKQSKYSINTQIEKGGEVYDPPASMVVPALPVIHLWNTYEIMFFTRNGQIHLAKHTWNIIM